VNGPIPSFIIHQFIRFPPSIPRLTKKNGKMSEDRSQVVINCACRAKRMQTDPLPGPGLTIFTSRKLTSTVGELKDDLRNSVNSSKCGCADHEYSYVYQGMVCSDDMPLSDPVFDRGVPLEFTLAPHEPEVPYASVIIGYEDNGKPISIKECHPRAASMADLIASTKAIGRHHCSTCTCGRIPHRMVFEGKPLEDSILLSDPMFSSFGKYADIPFYMERIPQTL
jgi:hypothetical protein